LQPTALREIVNRRGEMSAIPGRPIPPTLGRPRTHWPQRPPTWTCRSHEAVRRWQSRRGASSARCPTAMCSKASSTDDTSRQRWRRVSPGAPSAFEFEVAGPDRRQGGAAADSGGDR